ncbi:MAG: carboxypeptidase regulatory-like domain-containing protein [Myxococcales bacterium]|nr:carboxypeptidase regulatory-like domain-containing protein [Myxococcales bacterium]
MWIALAVIAAVIGGVFVLRSARQPSSAAARGPARPGPTVEASPPRAELPKRADRSVELDDDVAGTIRLEGQVIDADANPVAGATIAIDTRPSRTVTSEADGSFAIEDLTARSYELVATAGDLVGGPIGVQVHARTEPVILRLAAGATVEVAVALARDRSPVSGARVELNGLVDRGATTGPTGTAALRGVPPGWYLVVASASGFAPSTTFLEVTSSTAHVRLELVSGAPVSGRVVDPAGAPIAGARVRYEGVSDWTQAPSDAIETGADGRFRIAALPAGSFRFEARHDEHAPGVTDTLVLDGATAREGITIQLRPGAVLEGVVLDAARVPVPAARVRVREETAGLPMQRTRQVTTDAAGTFRFAGLPRTSVHVVALGEDRTSTTARVDLATSATARVELVLDLEGQIAGNVVDGRGEPVEGGQVWAYRDASDGGSAGDAQLRGEQVALTDGAGAFAFRGLSPGRYTLRAHPPGATPDYETLLLRPEVKATVGDRAVKLVLAGDGAVTGKVVFADGKPAMLFVASLGGWGSARTVSTKDGSFELRDLPPREYRITIRGAGFAERSLPAITVAPGKTADLGTITVHAGRSISGRVVDARGTPVAGATVLAGSTLWGTGSKASAPSGMGGPPGASGIKEATTDERGEFVITGVGRGPRHLVAEHDTLGRSVPITLPTTDRSATDVQVTLVAFGALEGKVTLGREPASRIVVNAQSKTVPETMYSVVTSTDGSYRFDRLAPDTYSVSAMLGADPMQGFGFHARTTTVRSGKPTRLDLAVETGDAVLVVRPTATTPVVFAMVYSVRGAVAARTAKELETKTLALDAGQSGFAMAIAGNPARLEKLAPGLYTVCASPFPGEVGFEVEDYLVREGDNLPVFCKQVNVAKGEASIDIAVTIPAFVPAPDE